ncbi:MAG: carbohydrate binding domain-containing protein [Candidatus Omnitrophica bacterium]|nr:carbohydrate binding domain-containing protein [Candidatus Omnitrophota bacterium]MDD5026968.1 carbohydrate binding domain-containing protein [Candidatus Omnitrophota bacterium]MDD5661646.1 carbohydrate binding domain-containing protein [Candidatus Omnitrophota bacterium]
MRKTFLLATAILFGCLGISFAADADLLVDDFEIIEISTGPQGTVDFGAGNGSAVSVSAATDIKNTGKQSLKVDFEAGNGGYIYVAKGKGLDAANAHWSINPEDIQWVEYQGFSFYMYGTNSRARIAFDIKDNGNELWRFVVADDFKGWKKIVCNFDKFMVRDDWQPGSADKNAKIDFPIKIFQFEPLAESKGTLYFDTVELVKK